MKEKEKKVLLDLLQDISYAYENGSFWKAWSVMHKYLSDIDTEGTKVHDIVWNARDDEGAHLPKEVMVPEEVDARDIAGYLYSTYGCQAESFCADKVSNDHNGHGFYIHTPAGPIQAIAEVDSGYAGAFLLYSETKSGEPGAVMEYDPKKEGVVLRIWTRDNPEGDPVDPAFQMS